MAKNTSIAVQRACSGFRWAEVGTIAGSAYSVKQWRRAQSSSTMACLAIFGRSKSLVYKR